MASDIPTEANQCAPCSTDGQGINAEYYCVNCKEYLCVSCRDQHRKLKLLRDHEISRLSPEPQGCDPCKTEGKEKEASFYCEDCASYLCHTCRDHHRKLNILKNHKVSLAKILTELTIKEPQATQSDANENVVILDLDIQASSKVSIQLPGDKNKPAITGCLFMPAGQLLLCDHNNFNLKLLDTSMTMSDSLILNARPWDVAALSENVAVISLHLLKKLQFIEIFPKLKEGTAVSFEKKCYGVKVLGNRIYVSCHDGSQCQDSKGEIRELDCHGNALRTIGINNDGSHLFKVPYYIAVDKSKDMLYVSEARNDTVTCQKLDGHIVYEYKGSELVGPRGMYVDGAGNIILCSRDNNSVIVVTASGKKHKTLLTSVNDIYSPRSVAFRPSDGTLVVGCYDQAELCVSKLGKT